jgi:hypothetical protein
MAEKKKKRKDGQYSKQVTIGLRNGKLIRKTIYGKTQKELDKNYRDFMSLKDKGIILQEENMTFLELSELWLTNEKIGSVTDQSITVTRSELRTINSYIGDTKVKDLKQSHIESFRSTMINSGKPIRYNTCLGRIRAIVRYAVYKEILAVDITASMKDIKMQEGQRSEP